MNFLSATQIHDGAAFLPEGTVLVTDDQGLIKDLITPADTDPGQVQHHEGILCPGFVNTHCHLELSHLLGKVPMHTGLVGFALEIMKQRNGFSTEQIEEAAAEADKQMHTNGIVAVGDISNTAHSIVSKKKSTIHYHTFIELISLNPARAGVVMAEGEKLLAQFGENGLSASLAPHAPYSVSGELMERIASANTISSIHNQECEAENDFFQNKSGDFLKLYEAINLPIDYFAPSGKSSLQTYLPHLREAARLLLVHNTVSRPEDLAFAKHTMNQLSWCLCPNANLYIENKLPAIPLFISEGCHLTLGTDSLASNGQLSIAAEIQSILAHYTDMSLETLLRWATRNGAEFLGLQERFGKLASGYQPGINLLRMDEGKLQVRKLA